MEVQAHIFRSATEIQSRPDALMESRAAATFFTLLGVLEILHSYKSFVKMDVGRKLPEASRFNISKKIYANRFALSDTHNKISGPTEHERYSRITFIKNTTFKLPEL